MEPYPGKGENGFYSTACYRIFARHLRKVSTTWCVIDCSRDMSCGFYNTPCYRIVLRDLFYNKFIEFSFGDSFHIEDKSSNQLFGDGII